MFKRFFTSDQHFDHTGIITHCSRPFADKHEMNEYMIKVWNSVVGPFDIVYHLGDFSLSDKVVPKILPRLNGTKYLVPGNHDRCFPARPTWTAKYEEYGFKAILPIHYKLTLRDGFWFNPEYEVVLSHIPYTSDQYDQRYPQYRPADEGKWLLHGHVHQHWKVNGRQINVGVDVWDYRPVSEQEIVKLINESA